MGKPYRQELASLRATYEWAVEAPLSDMQAPWRRFIQSDLLAVGSGGSFTAAVLATYLHEYYTGHFAKSVTPLDAALSSRNLSEAAVLILTAGGGNPDVLGAFRTLVSREPRRIGILCSRTKNRLAELSREFQFTDRFDFDSPIGKDGFLATNSLLATSVILARMYGDTVGQSQLFPNSFEEFLSISRSSDSSDDELIEPDFWRRESLIVLHGPTTRAAALDIESKLSEAAIQNVQPVDYRNFAHGRHHWIAHRSDSTAVLALVCDEIRDVADKTIKLLPKKTRILRIDLGPSGPVAAVAAIAAVIRLVGHAGEAVGIDPGRPKIPPFGRKIYHLRAFPKSDTRRVTSEDCAIERKTHTSVELLAANGELDEWRTACRKFVASVSKPVFRALVFDYDGTLCDEANRFLGLDPGVAKALCRVIRSGAMLGIATGRGKSVRKALQEALPKSLWKKVVVGYYNGSDIAQLADDSRPESSSQCDEFLRPIASMLTGDPIVSRHAQLEIRPHQIKIEVNAAFPADEMWGHVQQILFSSDCAQALLLRSDHSMDIISKGVTKRQVVNHIQDLLPPRANVLCIGDRGRWPGNDFTLLSHEYSLSVDQCPIGLDSCWNLGPPGSRGVQTALFYMDRMVKQGAGFKINLKRRGTAAK